MTDGAGVGPDPESERIRDEASGWVARMQNEPSPEVRADLEAWLAADPRHRQVYDRISRRFEGAAILRTSAKHAVQRTRTNRWPLAALAAAAALAFVLMPLAWNEQLDSPSDRPKDAVASQQAVTAVASRRGEIRTVNLADGSRVTLDTDSVIAVELGAAERRITLRSGRARFSVAHDRRPFTVTAAGGAVIARGTEFDVMLDADGRVRVVLLSGSVDVVPPASGQSAGAVATRRLAAGEEAIYARGAVSVSHTTGADGASWPQGIADFERITLAELVARANRYANRPIVIAEPEIGQLTLSGRFRINDPDRLAANAVSLLNLKVDEEPARLVIRRN
ncbi:FecR domain-containing protein [Sphingosinicella sp. LHD-64]|uniref:FecR family protein n=1 Tax=Sphingosinicella sp. LHD-64 TaxID=3072139 RepID=UPI00280DCE64|nr:FecR domain-containing protein [Sphingosinicella sp. LHD-64]MDQ8756239.1 FecR domain-containing protein [Sphingosinicella sp. LHD-64]